MIGISASNSPNAMPTRSRVRASMPDRPIPIEPAKLLRPTDTLTRRRPTNPDIWLAGNYMEPELQPFRRHSLTTTHCPGCMARAEWHRKLHSSCNPTLGRRSFKRYTPPGQEAHEGQTARVCCAVPVLTRRRDRPRQAHIHFECGVGDPGDTSTHSDDVRAPRHDSSQADRHESEALLAPRRDEAAGDPDLDARAQGQPRRRPLHPGAAEALANRRS